MNSWFQQRHERPLVSALLAAALVALTLAGAAIWAGQHRALELRVAFAQAEASRLAGLLNALVARVDQALIGLTLDPADQPGCDDRLVRTADTLPGAVTGFALVDPDGIIRCASIAALRGQRSVTASSFFEEAGAMPLVSFILAGTSSRDPVIIVQRPAPERRIVAAGLRVEALRLAGSSSLAAALEDSRGRRVALSDGQVGSEPPAAYFPPAATPVAVTLPAGRRVVARVSDHLAVTLDLERGLPADARRSALAVTGWVALALVVFLALILLLLRLTLLRPLRRLGEQLEGEAGTEGLIDWLSAHPASPMRHMAERIVARELNQEQRLALREALLREVNHRVAGHLQMVVSLLRLQAREDGPSEVADALRRAEHRVNTLALVHKGVQQAIRGERLDLLELLRSVAGHLVEGSPGAEAITLDVEGEALIVRPETGVPVALVLNEWITTALQRRRLPRAIAVCLRQEEGGAVLDYQDGDDNHAWPERAGLSPSIVEALSAQLGGRCERQRGRGWRLGFPLEPDDIP